jgi:hypothetical protein
MRSSSREFHDREAAERFIMGEMRKDSIPLMAFLPHGIN